MSRHIDVIGAPYDHGGGASGAREGPRAIIASGLLGELERVGHVATHKDLLEASENALFLPATPHALAKKTRTEHVNEVVGVISSLAAQTFASLRVGHTPLILGGDHSVVVGSVGAALHPDILCGKRLGLVWIDAHYDAHTGATTSSGHANGMPLASLLGRGLRAFRAPIGNRKVHPRNVLHIGAGKADCEPEEIALIERLQVPCFTEEKIYRNSMVPVREAYDRLCERVDHIWVSFDLDAVNRYWAPGVAFPNKNGLSHHMLMLLVDHLALGGKIIGADIVEHAPNREEYDACGYPKTATLAIDAAVRLFQ